MSISTKHYLWLGNLLILGLVVWSGMGLGLSMLSRRLEAHRSQAPVEIDRRAITRLRPMAHYEAMARHNIFGGKAQASSAPTDDDKNIPKQAADPNLRLRGTVVDPESGYAAAVLENTKSKQQGLYRPGDRIGSVEVLRIDCALVVLRQGNQEIRLKIFEEKYTKLPARPPRENKTIARSVGPNSYIVSRSALDQGMTNLNSFMSQVRIAPHFKSGQPHGFRVASVRRNSQLYKLGFRRGDVILKVNGVTVSKPDDLLNVYRQIQQLESVMVEVERRGRPVSLKYALR